MTIVANIIEGFKAGFGVGTFFGAVVGAMMIWYVMKDEPKS